MNNNGWNYDEISAFKNFKRFFWQINWLKTLYYNFKWVKFSDAIKLPIIIGYNVRIRQTGKIILENKPISAQVSKGESFTILKLEIIRRTLMLLILAVTVNFDIIVFVGGTAVYSFLLLFINLYYCGKPINYGVFQQLKDTMPIFFRLAIMVITALITSYFVQNLYIILRVIIVLCLSASVGIILFSRDSAFRETICLFKKILWKH